MFIMQDCNVTYDVKKAMMFKSKQQADQEIVNGMLSESPRVYEVKQIFLRLPD